MASERGTTTDVEIFGSTYHVRGEQDREYLRELASLVDRKMREIASRVQAADPTRVAILAALNLADELSQSHQRQEGERTKIQEKAAELAGELQSALQP
jgi:cell division protein ZapA